MVMMMKRLVCLAALVAVPFIALRAGGPFV